MSRNLPLWKRPLAAATRARARGRIESRPPAPFVVGVNRSGTTLLRMMLDAHPELAIPPETHFVPEMIRRARRLRTTKSRVLHTAVDHPRWGDFGLDAETYKARLKEARPLMPTTAVRAFYDLYAEKEGKPRWGDKTPRYMRAMPRIQNALPEARFVHLIRDGRDVAVSQFERDLADEAAPIIEVATRWQRRIVTAREHAEQVDHYIELRYEDLVADPEEALRRICEFIELPYDGAMLRYHERAAERLAEMNRDLGDGDGDDGPVRSASERLAGHAMTTEPPTTERCGRWRRELSAEDIATFERTAGGLLTDLGYPLAATETTTGDKVA